MTKLSQFFAGLKKGLHNFGSNVGIIVNSALLLIVYVLGIGATSVTAKIFGKHFLDRELSDEKSTYWLELNLSKKPVEEYYRQF